MKFTGNTNNPKSFNGNSIDKIADFRTYSNSMIVAGIGGSVGSSFDMAESKL